MSQFGFDIRRGVELGVLSNVPLYVTQNEITTISKKSVSSLG